MTDVRIVSFATLRETIADWWLLQNGKLDERFELANLAKVALMTDARSDPLEVLPDPDSTDRRGWWGDLDAGPIWQGWPIGTKNWLLTRAKISDQYSMEGDTVVRAEQYTRLALQPLVNNRIASRIDVNATRVGDSRIDVTVVIWRGPNPEVELRFQDLWAGVKMETTESFIGRTQFQDIMTAWPYPSMQ
jgi:phage gp46-like protein